MYHAIALMIRGETCAAKKARENEKIAGTRVASFICALTLSGSG
jgi:hypothetical protein